MTYAVFAAAARRLRRDLRPGHHRARDQRVAATPQAKSATITWTTDEPATSQVAYGTDPATLSSTASTSGRTTSHSVTLTGLDPATTYSYRITSADRSGNTTTVPAVPAAPSQLTTTLPELIDTTAADFGAGTRVGTLVTDTGDGAVASGTRPVEDFDGSGLPPSYQAGTPWTSREGRRRSAAARSSVDGAPARSTATFGPGASVEFVATFGGAPSQHIGFGTDLVDQPWAFFSTSAHTGTLFARTKSASEDGSTRRSPRRRAPTSGLRTAIRIAWAADAVRYYVDGNLVQTHDARHPHADAGHRQRPRPRRRDRVGRPGHGADPRALGHVHVPGARRRRVDVVGSAHRDRLRPRRHLGRLRDADGRHGRRPTARGPGGPPSGPAARSPARSVATCSTAPP